MPVNNLIVIHKNKKKVMKIVMMKIVMILKAMRTKARMKK